MTADLDLGWMSRAACRGLTRLMYPALRNGRASQDGVYDEALAICATCPVLDDCRAWAETQPDQWDSVAVVGGLTPAQRSAPVACGPRRGEVAGYARHRQANESPCDPCRIAVNEYSREHKRRRRKQAS